jgi:AcrR family transcriptional regulator
MGRSSLYHYYRDKASLLRDIIKEVLKEEEALFAAAATGEGSPRERILGLMATLASFFEEWSAVGRMLFDLRLRDAGGFRPFFRRVRGYLGSLIKEGQHAGEIESSLDPHLSAAVLIGAVDGLLLQHFVDPKAFPDADKLRDALMNAVRKVLVP